MLCIVNGQLVPAEAATVSVADRGFLYGDGLFETLLVYHGRPIAWPEHFERLARGAAFLGIPLPCLRRAMWAWVQRLIRENQMPEGALRLQLSRGVGARGYSPRGAGPPTLVMTIHPLPEGDLRHPPSVRVVTASVPLPVNDPLTPFKTCNKLPHILARAEAEQAGADEALLLNAVGWVGTASSANLFWIRGNTLSTPPVRSGALAGVTRQFVKRLASAVGLGFREQDAPAEWLLDADGVFLTSSLRGLVDVAMLDGHPLRTSVAQHALRDEYWRRVVENRA